MEKATQSESFSKSNVRAAGFFFFIAGLLAITVSPLISLSIWIAGFLRIKKYYKPSRVLIFLVVCICVFACFGTISILLNKHMKFTELMYSIILMFLFKGGGVLIFLVIAIKYSPTDPEHSFEYCELCNKKLSKDQVIIHLEAPYCEECFKKLP